MEVSLGAPFRVCNLSPLLVGKIPLGILTGFFSNFQLLSSLQTKLHRNLFSSLAFKETDGYIERTKPPKTKNK